MAARPSILPRLEVLSTIVALALTASLLMAGLAVYAAHLPGYQGESDVHLAWRDGGWVVTWVLPAGMSFDAGLRPGDRIVAVGGQFSPEALAAPDLLTGQGDLLVARGERTVLVSLEPAPLSVADRLAFGVGGLFFALIGLFVWQRGGRDRVQVAFLALCGLAGIGLVSAPAALQGHVHSGLVLVICSTLVPTTLLVFLRLFPTPWLLGIRRWSVAPEWLWLVPMGWCLGYLASAAGWVDYDALRPWVMLWQLVMLLGVMVTVGQRVWQAHRTEDGRTRTQLRIIGGGALLGFLPLLAVIVPQLTGGEPLVDPALVVPATAALPLAIAYAMMRYQVMDVELVVRRGLARTVAAGLLALALLGMVSVIHQVAADDRGLEALLLVLVVLAGVPLYNWLVRHLDRVVYGANQDAGQTLATAARALVTTLDEQQVLARALEQAVAVAQPSFAVLYERDEAGGHAALAWQWRSTALGGGPAAHPVPVAHPARALLGAGRSWQAGGTLLRRDGLPPITDPAQPVLLVAVGGPESSGPPRWLLGLGARPSGLPYSREDIALLEALGLALAAALANARHYGHLQAAYAELHQTQLQLIQAAKMAALGEISSGVAHELSQPLMVMRGRLQQVIALTQDQRLQTRLARVEEQTHKMERIVTHMRSFARQTRNEHQSLSLAQVVDEALLLLGEQVRGRGIELTVALPPGLPAVLGDAGQLEQVVINLLSNARDALAGRSSPRITITAESSPGERQILLAVSDNGAGIPDELRGQIFDAFFTTKPDGQGTGLGLSISRNIVTRHGGRLECESTPGLGTTFRLVLPVAEAAGQPPLAETAA
jgi:signal transduction histidine kinase